MNEKNHTVEQKDEERRAKRQRVASIALESEDACSNETFMTAQCGDSDVIQQQQLSPINYSSSSKRSPEPISSK